MRLERQMTQRLLAAKAAIPVAHLSKNEHGHTKRNEPGMRALALMSFDGPTAVELVELPSPEVGEGEVLVEVSAAALGPWDPATTHGAFVAAGGIATFPQIQGWDMAGTVAAVGEGVERFVVGDRVVGFTPQPWSGVGVFAEQVALPADQLSPVPASLTFARAAVLPVTSLTADLALRTAAVGSGDSLLVIGAGGMVGGAVVQLAKFLGVQVVAVVRGGSAEASRLGAEHVLNADDDFAGGVRRLFPGGVDACIDMVGGEEAGARLGVIADGGRYVRTTTDPLPATERDIATTAIQVQPDADRLTQLVILAAQGELDTRVSQALPLADGPGAMQPSGADPGPGKTVLIIGDGS
jgi:NADPH2:quinone reductase